MTNNYVNPINAVTSARENFHDFFFKGVSLPTLVDGEYTAVVKNVAFVQPAEINKNPYVRVELILNDGRMIVNNVFVQGFDIFINTVKRQLNMSDQQVPVYDFCIGLIGKELNVWIQHITKDGKSFRNVYYAPPIVQEQEVEEEFESEDF